MPQPDGQRETPGQDPGSLPSFGLEMRRRRVEAGLSLGRFATLVHYSKSHLSKIENGVKPAGVDLARRCDAALGAGGRLADMAFADRADDPAATGTDTIDPFADEVWEMTLAPDGSIRFVPRRQVLIGGAVSILGVGLGRGAAAAAADSSMVAELWSAFDTVRRLGQRTAPAVVLPGLIAQAHTARGLAGAASGAARRDLLTLSARYAELTSWMVQETGDDAATEWWLALTARLATSAGDADLAAYTRVRRAEVALYRDDGRATVELAKAAREDARLSARVRGMAAQREAQGLSLLGDVDGCQRALDRAAAFAGTATEQAGGALGSSTTPDLLAVVTGWCLHGIGQPLRSAEILESQMASFSPLARRARARFGARLALAYAAAAEVEQACAVADWVLRDAELVGSATITADVRRLAATLRRWPTSHAVREIAPRLSAALYAPGR